MEWETYQAHSQIIQRRQEAAGLEWVSPHIMRHTAGTIAFDANVDIRKISKMLGHSDIKTTEQVCIKYSSKMTREATEALSEKIMEHTAARAI